MVLNKRLRGINARDVLSIGSEIIHPLKAPIDLTRVETFPGAACLTRFALMQPAEANIADSFWCDPKRLPSNRVPPFTLVAP
jgi:hypothetical protein